MIYCGLRAMVAKEVLQKDVAGTVPDEWVLPSFFTENSFIGSVSFKPCHVARVDQGFDPDECLQAFAKQYPGIPRLMLEKMVLAMTMALSHQVPEAFRKGAVVRPVTGNNSAGLVSSATGETLQLWDGIDPAQYL